MKGARSTNKNPKCDPPDAKRIVIVDDHPLFRKGLEQLIHSDGAFAVCGEAGNAPEAMDVIRKLDPDLVIVDLSLPGAGARGGGSDGASPRDRRAQDDGR